ncbi:MAG TPA: nickel pincer cofactor biosynthesis protein LarC [bacterium]|nr:nickel pincer cofactor biosynthesis protein LarC [bacterium]
MRLGYLDCASGASGDMLLGALLGAGWPRTALQRVVADLGVPVRLTVTRAERRGVPALRVEVTEDNPAHERLYPELAAIVDRCRVAAPVRRRAARVLHRLAEVESRVHGVPVERVHLHELGGLDTVVDVAGVLAGIEALGLDRIAASPVSIGRGWVRIRHGLVPVPAPATQALIEGMPVYAGDVEGEWLTPTGAALLKELVTEWGPLPPMRVDRIGTGAGRDDPERANVLRLFVGERQKTSASGAADRGAGAAAAVPFGDGARTERLVMLETSIDDMNPQLYPYVTARLIEAGALEVATVPAVMKKGRPGHVLRVLASQARAKELTGVLLAETTTLGVRAYEVSRLAATRRTVDVDTEYGRIPVKIAVDGDVVLNVAPEFEACRAAAESRGVPVKQVIAAALRVAPSSPAKRGAARARRT